MSNDNLPIGFDTNLVTEADPEPDKEETFTDRLRLLAAWVEQHQVPIGDLFIHVNDRYILPDSVSFRCPTLEQFQLFADIFGEVKPSQNNWDFQITKIGFVAGFELRADYKITHTEPPAFPEIRMVTAE